MEKCKYCQAELAENGTFCPSCGKNNAEEAQPEEVTVAEEVLVSEETPDEEAAPAEQEAPAEVPEKKKASPGKIALAVAAVVVLLAVLIALLAGGFGGNPGDENIVPAETGIASTEPVETVPATIPADGNPDDETCKGTYTASAEEVLAAADVVVATAGDRELTNGQLQVYYWMEVQNFLSNYGYYLSYFGLDYTKPLDTQVCSLAETGTWQQFFLSSALMSWQNYQAMAAESELAGCVLPEEYQEQIDNLEQVLTESAAANGFASVEDLIAYNLGGAATYEAYLGYTQMYYQGLAYYDEVMEQIKPTQEDLEAYFAEHEADYTENGITKEDIFVDVRHILVMPEGGTTGEDGQTTYSEEEWEVCRQEAQAILDEWLAGDKTEDSFATLANERTDDGNDANYDGIPDGGLYTQVVKGKMVPEFEEWCFDESRVSGDYGLVKTVYGYHVMYFVNSSPQWEYYTESDYIKEKRNAFVDETVAKYPLTVDYSAILLALSGMGA